MKKETINKVKLGIFVTIGVSLLVTGILFIGQTKKLFSSTFRVSALFKDINGLQVGNNVRFAGINVGSVEDINILTDSSVKVDMIIDVSTQKFIKKNAKAIIGTDGLMGNKIMTVSAGTIGFPEIQNNDMIGTNTPINVDDMLYKLKTTSDNAALITTDMAAIFGSIRYGKGTVGKLLMDTVFAENLDRTLVNAKQGSRGFKENMDAASQSFLLGGFFSKTPQEKRDEKIKEQKKLKEEKLKEKKKLRDEKLKLKDKKSKDKNMN